MCVSSVTVVSPSRSLSEKNFRIAECFVRCADFSQHHFTLEISRWMRSRELLARLARSGWTRMVKRKPEFERSEANIFIAMHLALDKSSHQILSVDVRACKHNDWTNPEAFFLAGFWIQHIPPGLSRCQSSFGTNKTYFCMLHIFIPHSCVLDRKREDSCLVIRPGIGLTLTEAQLCVLDFKKNSIKESNKFNLK